MQFVMRSIFRSFSPRTAELEMKKREHCSAPLTRLPPTSPRGAR